MILFFLSSNWLLWRSPSQVSASERSGEDGGGQEVGRRSCPSSLSEFRTKTERKKQSEAGGGGSGGGGGRRLAAYFF